VNHSLSNCKIYKQWKVTSNIIQTVYSVQRKNIKLEIDEKKT